MGTDNLSDLLPRFDQRGMDLQLDRMERALKALGNPCGTIPAIQIAGTNGKGSIASFIKAALQSAGVSCGVTTSPHLVSWSERIVVNGHAISIGELRQLLQSQAGIAQTFHLTPFERLLAAALEHFNRNNVELLVLEVGLGGRLDATTAHPLRPVIAMASIGLDHTEHLGTTRAAIAAEKAAVITPGACVISAEQHPEVRQVLEATCSETGAELCWVSPLAEEWSLGLAGEWQRSNAAVARGALQALGPLGWTVADNVIRAGFAKAHWPGRLQCVRWQGHPLLLDGAHNPPAAEQLALERQGWPREQQGVIWIFGIQAHKQAQTMLQTLLQPQDKAWIVPVPGHRSWERDDLLQGNPQWSHQLANAASVEQALSEIHARGKIISPPPVLAGSLYLIGDLLTRGVITAE